MRYEELWQQLTDRYDTGEAKAIVRYLMEIRYGLSMTDILCGKVDSLPEDELGILLSRLKQAEPVQYVTGVAEFGGLRFHVTKDVLIPRPETYELCQWVIEDVQNRSEQGRIGILDIGTGSGCIAITLAKKIPHSEVTAWDISVDALRVAEENARLSDVHVTFEQHDILSHPSSLLPPPSSLISHPSSKWSTIVSNPPYICPSEKATMSRNVIDYEPHLALFVPEEDPLLFYRSIAQYAIGVLPNNGTLYFEINPTYVTPLQKMLVTIGFQQVTVREDQFGKQRFMKAIRHSISKQ